MFKNSVSMVKSEDQQPSGSFRFSAYLILLAIVVLAAELFLISYQYDAATLRRNDAIAGWKVLFSHLGDLAKLTVLFVCVWLFISRDKLSGHWASVRVNLNPSRFLILMLLQVASYYGLMVVTGKLFGAPLEADKAPGMVYALWVGFVTLVMGLWLLSQMSFAFIRQFVKEEIKSLALAFVACIVIWVCAMASQLLWNSILAEELVEGTFFISTYLLVFAGMSDLIYVEPDKNILGLGDFVVQIAPSCSGYEGIGLVTAFTAIYLFMHRRDFVFPRAFILFPVGAVLVWFLNSVRIAVLVLLGYYWSPDVAVGGFHSQAGWITFIMTSIAVIWVAGKTRLVQDKSSASKSTPISLPIATLLPMVVWLAVTLLTSAFISGFDYLYPLRVIVVGIVLIRVWPLLQLTPYRPRLEAVAAALFVAVFWVLMLGSSPEQNSKFVAGLDSMSPLWMGVWLLCRFIGSALIIPIAEELAFRGYMYSTLAKTEVKTRGKLPVVIVAALISSLAFGLLHGAWLAGTLAGLVYMAVRLRSDHMGDAILAHAGTNGLLIIYASITGEWSVL